jgi:SNF2 family DNA or RNA helicase
VVADEAHRLRNSGSLQSKGFRKLVVDRIWFLSGTPLERDVLDILTLMSFLKPSIFSTRDKSMEPVVIRGRAKPFVLRRMKSEVLKDLPEVTYRHEFLELSPVQRDAYQKAQKWTGAGNVLTRFGTLRAICDLEADTGSSIKIERIIELVEQIRELGESVVIFSYWNEPLVELKRRLLEIHGNEVFHFHAGLSLARRNEVLDAFRSSGGILLASAHIASEGLTLIEANHAIFLNQYWNPSINRQAEDRIRRIGQVRHTFVYTFTCIDTVEIVIDEMLARKSEDEHDFVELLAEHLN